MTGEAAAPRPELVVLRVDRADLADDVVVVGDPDRARSAAALLTDSRQIGSSREYLSFTGHWAGRRVSVVSHGVGAAGAAVCFTELARAGVRRIVRAGTCGGLQPEVLDGSLVVATGAVRNDGVTDHLVPPGFPAIADAALTAALQAASAACGLPVHVGVVLTNPVLYPLPVLGSDLQLWQRAGAVAVEMELSALLIVAALHGVAAGGIFAVDGNPLAERDDALAGYSPYRDIVLRASQQAVRSALDALVG